MVAIGCGQGWCLKSQRSKAFCIADMPRLLTGIHCANAFKTGLYETYLRSALSIAGLPEPYLQIVKGHACEENDDPEYRHTNRETIGIFIIVHFLRCAMLMAG